jgi:hypothetical protein
VDEYWVCQHCHSLNRTGTSRCYHCREPQGSTPPEVGSLHRNAGAGSVAQFPGAVRPAPATYTPPAPRGAADPGYLSQPVATPLAPVPDFTTRYREAEAAARKSRLQKFQPTGPIRRRLSAALATRPYVSIRFAGYLSAVLATLALLDAALLVASFAPVARTALETSSLTTAWSQVSSPATLALMLGALAVLGVAGLVVFSAFVGLSTHNARGLGAEAPHLSPALATTCWAGILGAQAFIAASLLVPAYLVGTGYALPGLLVALVALELAQRRIDNLFGWLIDPARHVRDLLVKLGTSGSNRSLIGSAWRFTFVTANLLAILAMAMPALVIAAVAVADLAGRQDLASWPGPSSSPIQIAILAVLGLLALSAALATLLFVPVSIELVERQRTRRNLAKQGRARPWAGRGAGQDPVEDRQFYDPYDNPRVAARYGDQASLNSPSTTSSFPWDGGSSDELPSG